MQNYKEVVFLFKSQKEKNEKDIFFEALKNTSTVCCVIPVLSFNYINQDKLKKSLENVDDLSGIILTSVRSVESLRSLPKETKKHFTKIPCFVTGKATYIAAKNLGFQPEGEESGNSTKLTEYILQKDLPGPFLYPCSNIRKDTMTETLLSGGIRVNEVVCYETCSHPDLAACTLEALKNHGVPKYIVFFSPSGFHFVQEMVKKGIFTLQNSKLIALGPSTYEAIRNEGICPHATLDKPEPQSLLDLIQQDTLDVL